MVGRHRRRTQDDEEEQDVERKRRHISEEEDSQDEQNEEELPMTQIATQASTSQRATIIADLTTEELKRKIKGIVRLALASEARRSVVRRDDIRKVLGDQSRAYNTVFDKAQEKLRQIFGMELAELPQKESGGPLKGRPNASKSQTTKSYILRNVMPIGENVGDIFEWQKGTETYMGFVYAMLSLIHVHGRVMETGRNVDSLLMLLEKLGLSGDTVSTLTGGSIESMDRLIATMVKQGYLTQQKESAQGSSTREARTAHNPTSSTVKWGPRAKVEVGDGNIGNFIVKVWGEDAPRNLLDSIAKAAEIPIAGET